LENSVKTVTYVKLGTNIDNQLHHRMKREWQRAFIKGLISSTVELASKMRNFFWGSMFGKWCTNLAKFRTVIWQNSADSKFLKLNGEFFAEHCVPATFCLAHKVW